MRQASGERRAKNKMALWRGKQLNGYQYRETYTPLKGQLFNTPSGGGFFFFSFLFLTHINSFFFPHLKSCLVG